MDSVQLEVDISTAAERLGISAQAVRQRIRRKSLQAIKRNDRWYVILDTATDVHEADTTRTVDADSTGLQDDEEVRILRQELNSTRCELAAALESVHRLEEERSNLIAQQDKKDVQLSQALQLVSQLQQAIALPAPEVKKSFWQRWFGKM